MATARPSCEASRTSAYSHDLRWRIVWQREALNMPVREVAGNLCVDPSTVSRITTLFRTTGDVAKKPYPSERASRKLTEPAQFFIIYLILDRPGIYLREVQLELQTQLGLNVSQSALCKFLHKTGFTRQRLSTYALQRDECLRSQFAADVSLYSPEMLIFLDETGTDRRDTLRKKGYSLRGKPAKSQKLLVRGEHVSVISALSVEGILVCQIQRGSVSGETFYDFILKYLVPHLMPFDGVNPNSVVIFDNCSIHHISEVISAIQDTGAILHFLPPYSPDWNPAEGAFSKVKTMMKAMEMEMQTIEDIDTIIYAAFSFITHEDCIGWIKDSGIYNM